MKILQLMGHLEARGGDRRSRCGSSLEVPHASSLGKMKVKGGWIRATHMLIVGLSEVEGLRLFFSMLHMFFQHTLIRFAMFTWVSYCDNSNYLLQMT